MRRVLNAILAMFSRQRPPAETQSPPVATRKSPAASAAAGTGGTAGAARDALRPAVPDSPQEGGRKRTIRAALPADRLSDGTFTVEDEDEDGRAVLGPHPVICVVDKMFAARAGNPDASRRRPFGDIPAGRYRHLGLARPGDVALPTDEDTGVHPVLVFRAIDGEAAIAEAAGRGDLLLHGGPAEPTLGTLRLSDDVLAAVLASVATGPAGGTEVTLVVADSARSAAGPPPQPRRTILLGPFPHRPDAAARSPSPERSWSAGTAATTNDPMDGFLLSYLIGWPVNATPGSFLGTVLHSEEHRRDDSAERLRAAGVPVLRDDGQGPHEQPAGTEGHSGGTADERLDNPPRVGGSHEAVVPVTGTPMADMPPPASDATSQSHYTPSGGAYDR